MKREETRRYESFKQACFRWFLALPDDGPFSAAAGGLLALLKEELALQGAALYLFDPSRGSFYLEAAAGMAPAERIAADQAGEIVVTSGGGPYMAARLFVRFPMKRRLWSSFHTDETAASMGRCCRRSVPI